MLVLGTGCHHLREHPSAVVARRHGVSDRPADVATAERRGEPSAATASTAEPMPVHVAGDVRGARPLVVRDDAGSSVIVGLALGAVAIGLLFVLYLRGLGT